MKPINSPSDLGSQPRKSAIAYVDGMNLYYGAVKRRPECKWLDIRSMLEGLFPSLSIELIRYYTAKIQPEFPLDRHPLRQMKFIEALEASQNVKVRFGTFSRHSVLRRIDESDGLNSPDLFRPPLEVQEAQIMGRLLNQVKTRNTKRNPYVLVQVLNIEEKGSDVNLATDLIMDTLVNSKCDTAIVVTNDSDFRFPITSVANSSVNIILVNPYVGPKGAAKGLSNINKVTRKSLGEKDLLNHQLPDPVVSQKGIKLYKPKEWNKKPST